MFELLILLDGLIDLQMIACILLYLGFPIYVVVDNN